MSDLSVFSDLNGSIKIFCLSHFFSTSITLRDKVKHQERNTQIYPFNPISCPYFMFWPIVTPSSCLDIVIIDTLKTMSDLLCEAISADEVKLICIYSSNVMDATSKSTKLAKLALRSTLSRKTRLFIIREMARRSCNCRLLLLVICRLDGNM